MRIQPSDVEVLLDTLRQHRLVTGFTFPNLNRDSDLPMWAKFDLKLQGLLLSIGARFADPLTFTTYDYPIPAHQNTPKEYHNLPWLLLNGGRLRHGRWKITPAGPIVFLPKTLHSAIGTWGRATSNYPLLFIGINLFRVKSVSFVDAYLYTQGVDSQKSMLFSRHFQMQRIPTSVTVVLRFKSMMPSAIQGSSHSRIESYPTL